jgi:hypothetical protein
MENPDGWIESQRKKTGEITPAKEVSENLLTKRSGRAWHGMDFRELN